MIQAIPWILDVVCLGVLAVSMAVYYCRGFVKVFLSFLGFVAAVVLGVLAAQFLSRLLFNQVIRDTLVEALTQYQWEGGVTQDLAQSLIGALNSLPGWVSGILSLFSLDTGKAVEIIDGLAHPDTTAMAVSLTEDLLQPLFLSFLGLVLFLFSFVVLLFLFRRLADLAGGLVERLPLIHGVNRLLGGVVGAANGLLWVFVLASLAALFLLVTKGGTPWLNLDLIQQSLLFSRVMEQVPF